MSPREIFRIALSGVAANKLRSGLTILGMTIGVSAVIILVAVGNGSKLAVQEGINTLGSNVLLVQAQPGGFGPGGPRTGVTFSREDAAALGDEFNAPDVKRVSPVMNATGTTFVAGETSYEPSTVTGTVPGYAETRSYEVASGSMFTSDDVEQHKRVVVLGPTVVQNLYGGADPVGQSVRINGTLFQIVGVTEAKGASGQQDQDDIALAPLTAVQDAITGYGSGLSSITVEAKDAESLDAAQAEVESILNDRKNPTDPTNPGFSVINQGSVREVASASTEVFATLLGAVAAISMLVGGIGVMNIMLVSVTERTREIGIRKAIGGRRADIMAQFLTEAVVISAIGGVTGVLVGVIGSQFQIAGVEPVIALYSIVLAFGASVLSGLFFGTYPAGRAARMRPIEALRFE